MKCIKNDCFIYLFIMCILKGKNKVNFLMKFFDFKFVFGFFLVFVLVIFKLDFFDNLLS